MCRRGEDAGGGGGWEERKEGLARGKMDSGEKVDAAGWREEVNEGEK